MAFSLSAKTRLLVVSPHPDDESIATGELIQQVRQFGGEVRILLLTNGDNNPWPQRWMERRLRIGAEDRRRWGERRRTEVTQALAQLGVEPASLHALGWPDMGITDLLRGDLPSAVSAISASLDEFQPNLVAMPALGDRHPDHGASHVLVRQALARWGGPAPELLAYLVHGREGSVTGRIKLDSSVGLHANKLAALACHRSQMALSGKRMRRLADRSERYLQVRAPASEGQALVLPWTPPSGLHRWLHLMLVDGRGARSWPWGEAPVALDGQARVVLHALDGEAPGPRFAKLYMNLASPWIFDRWGWCEL
ncbi:MAG TPA: PIG-L family deacetylase [Dyella sp.]|uniref:PIG-L deacetylase family protein n=1 Tax=Dyella sp. TaxID=1869338 RepID=UPI002D785E3B|nr:PIG-L family deacetylase [Dyella sp.]HET6552092.1 PIG-L family deacetylase [Dyella sp.]